MLILIQKPVSCEVSAKLWIVYNVNKNVYKCLHDIIWEISRIPWFPLLFLYIWRRRRNLKIISWYLVIFGPPLFFTFPNKEGTKEYHWYACTVFIYSKLVRTEFYNHILSSRFITQQCLHRFWQCDSNSLPSRPSVINRATVHKRWWNLLFPFTSAGRMRDKEN